MSIPFLLIILARVVFIVTFHAYMSLNMVHVCFFSLPIPCKSYFHFTEKLKGKYRTLHILLQTPSIPSGTPH